MYPARSDSSVISVRRQKEFVRSTNYNLNSTRVRFENKKNNRNSDSSVGMLIQIDFFEKNSVFARFHLGDKQSVDFTNEMFKSFFFYTVYNQWSLR